VQARIKKESGLAPPHEVIAQELGVTVKRLRDIYKALRDTRSTSAPIGGTEMTIEDSLEVCTRSDLVKSFRCWRR
jgi:DNA-directed RNA polymerase sigma subunit (sigma70/sigma32)